MDGYDNTATGYTGTVQLTSTDGAATLPADYTFTGGDAGVHAFTNGVTLKTAGIKSITATDTVTGSITGTQGSITVNPAAASTLTVSDFPSLTTAGVSHNVTVTAKDGVGNTVTGYAGTVHLTSSDGAAVLAGDSTLTGGTGTFAVTLNTAGPQSITATDTVTGSITGTQGSITVNPAAASTLTVSDFPSLTTAGVSHNVTVTAKDGVGNTVTGYAGTVHLTSSDGAAVLAGDSTLTGGTGTFAVTLKTAGPQSITATDTVTGSITGTQGSITVNPAAATAIRIEDAASGGAEVGAVGLASGTATTVHAVTVDAFGNQIANVAATWSLTSKTGGVANGDLVAAGDGKSATMTGGLAGTAMIHAVATAGGYADDTGTMTVSAGTLDHIVLSPGTSTITAGGSQAYTAQAFDAAGNSLGDVTGSTSFGMTPDGSCVAASCSATVAGAHTVTGTYLAKVDTASLTVDAGAATHLVVTASSPQVSGAAFGFTVAAQDAHGNVDPAYAGTVTFTSTDGSSTLPDPYAFQPGDAGSRGFSATLVTSGAQTITATDTVTGSITGTSGTITIP